MIVNTRNHSKYTLIQNRVIIYAMSDKHEEPSNWGGKREGAGRKPVKNGKLVRRNIGLTESQIEWLDNNFDNVSAFIRELIDREMSKAGRPPKPDGAEG